MCVCVLPCVHPCLFSEPGNCCKKSVIVFCFNNVHTYSIYASAITVCVKEEKLNSVCVHTVHASPVCVCVYCMYWVWSASLVYIVKSMSPVVVRPASVLVLGDTLLCVCVCTVIVTLGRESDTVGEEPPKWPGKQTHPSTLFSSQPFHSPSLVFFSFLYWAITAITALKAAVRISASSSLLCVCVCVFSRTSLPAGQSSVVS